MSHASDQPRRGRPPLPDGMAKVKRNVRLGPIWDQAEHELVPGETMTHFLEAAMHHEIARRRRVKRRAQEGAPPAEAGGAS